MQRRTILGATAAGGLLAATGGLTAAVAEPRALPGDFRHGYANVNGVRLHYVAGGRGEPLFLLPGWPRTWWEFHKVMGDLARTHRVIVVELRGMGDSAKPEDGYDKKTMAADIAALARRLGHERIDVIGSDIGAMVAFSMAANHPDLVRKVALIDVAHPEVGMYDLTLLPKPGQPFHLWWFAFNQVRGLPEQLIAGRSRALVDYLCELILVDQDTVSDRDRDIYARAYNTPDAIRAGNGWYQTFGQDIVDDGTYAPVPMPLLALAGAGNYEYLRGLLPTKAVNSEVRLVENAGHYLVEEQPKVVLDHLVPFLA
jgi:pimeloyl-ACP methyl ester carboxylesterase